MVDEDMALNLEGGLTPRGHLESPKDILIVGQEVEGTMLLVAEGCRQETTEYSGTFSTVTRHRASAAPRTRNTGLETSPQKA